MMKASDSFHSGRHLSLVLIAFSGTAFAQQSVGLQYFYG